MNNIQIKVNLDFEQLLLLVKQLSPIEKLKLNDSIWDDAMEIPLEHQLIVLDRISKSKTNPNNLLDWDKVSKTLK